MDKKKITIQVSGSNAEAVSALTSSLAENKMEVFKTPLFYGKTTLAFPEGLYDVAKDEVILEIRAAADSIQRIISNLVEKPGIILS